MPPDEIVGDWIKFKFKKTVLIQQIQRLNLQSKMDLARGPILIKIFLKKIELEKELFSLMLQRGGEVKIPKYLSQSNLPFSFRYYDSIVAIVKSNLGSQNRDFSKLKKSISYAFNQRFQSQSIFNRIADGSKGKLKTQHNIRSKEDSRFNFIKSVHTMQVQNSKYLTIDDDFVN